VPAATGAPVSRIPPLRLDRPRWLPMTGPQIVARFRDRTLVVNENYQPLPGVRVETYWVGGCPPSETFSANGGWTRSMCQRMAKVYEGKWTTEPLRGAERLCVEAPDFPKLCRFVWEGKSREEVFMAADWGGGSEEDARIFNPYRLIALAGPLPPRRSPARRGLSH